MQDIRNNKVNKVIMIKILINKNKFILIRNRITIQF